MMMDLESSLITNNSKGAHHGQMVKGGSNEVPNLEPMSSYDSSSTTATSEGTSSPSKSTTTVPVPELLVETSTALRQVLLEEQLLAMAEDDVSLLAPETHESQSQHYFSKQEFQTLLTPTFIECLEATTEDFNTKKQAQRLRRKELIQQELEVIIQATATTMANDEGQEFEPEAVEALGIAANRVAYLKKYYDVTSCQYIYVPSVAYTILNGSLLEEACKHYYGKSEEFLIAYAASLGTTVLQNGLPQVLPGQDHDCDDDIKDDMVSDNTELRLDSQQGYTTSLGTTLSLMNDTSESTAIKYWGVSPLSTAQSVSSATNKFTFDASATPNKSPCDSSVAPTDGSTIISSVAAMEDGTLDSSVVPMYETTYTDSLVAAKDARLDCIVAPMDSTLDYSVTPQNHLTVFHDWPKDSPADSSVDAFDFLFDSPLETKDGTTYRNIAITPKDSTCKESITPRHESFASPEKPTDMILDSSIADNVVTLDTTVGTPKGSVGHGSDTPNELVMDADDNVRVLTIHSSATVTPVTTGVFPSMPLDLSTEDPTIATQTPLDLSAEPNPLPVDCSVATDYLSVLPQDSARNGCATPKGSTTGTSSPDKTQDSTLEASVSVKSTTMEFSAKPDCTADCSITPKKLTANSSDESLLDSCTTAKNGTVNNEVGPYNSPFHTTSNEAVKPYDSDSTCDVAAHDFMLDSSVTAFHSTLDTCIPNDLTSHSCVTPTDSKLDSVITAKDWTQHERSLSPKEAPFDGSLQTSGSILDSTSVAASNTSATGNASRSSPVKKPSQRLFSFLVLISIAIGATLIFSVNNVSSTMEQPQEQQRKHLGSHSRQPSHARPSTPKATSGPAAQNWDFMEAVTAWQRSDACNSISASQGPIEKDKVITADFSASSSTARKNPTPTRPIVANLLY